MYISTYASPIGKLLLASKENQLIGLWMEDQKYYLSGFKDELKKEVELEIFKKTKNWLDQYFGGQKPDIKQLDLNPLGSEFRQEVWKILMDIPYGQVITYNDIAKEVAKKKGITKMSAQAVGNAVGHNPISIIIPCHRVIGTNGSLVGYAGGIEKKLFLLNHENADLSKLFIPNQGSAL